MTQPFHPQAFTGGEKSIVTKRHVQVCSKQLYPQLLQTGSNPNAHQWGKWMNREKWVPSGYNKEGENLIVCKDVEPLEPLYTASRNVQFNSCCGKQPGSSSKAKYRLTIRPSNSTPRYRPKRIESKFKKNLPRNLYSSTVCKSGKGVTTQMSINRWMHKLNVLGPQEGIKWSHMIQHGCTLKTLCWVKKAREKWFRVVWNMFRTGQSTGTESRLVVASGWEGGGWGRLLKSMGSFKYFGARC